MPEPEYLEPPNFAEVHVARTFVFCVLFCESLFGLLSVFFWPLHCLSVYYLRLLMTTLVSSSFLSKTFSLWIAQNKITVPRMMVFHIIYHFIPLIMYENLEVIYRSMSHSIYQINKIRGTVILFWAIHTEKRHRQALRS
jgi:hypothetical protein